MPDNFEIQKPEDHSSEPLIKGGDKDYEKKVENEVSSLVDVKLAINRMCAYLTDHNYNIAFKIKDKFEFPYEVMCSEDVQEAIKNGIKNLFSTSDDFSYDLNMLNSAIKEFGASVETITYIDEHVASLIQKKHPIQLISFLSERGRVLTKTFQISKEKIFNQLSTDQDLADYFIENLYKYYQQSWVSENVLQAIQHYSVAQKFIYAVENNKTEWKSEAWVTGVLTKAKTVVEEHQKQFNQDEDLQTDGYGYRHGSEGFSEKDPYENHPWRFDSEQIHIANIISKIMYGQISSQEIDDLGVYARELTFFLDEINRDIDQKYKEFLEDIKSNPNIENEDKQALLNPEANSVNMTSLLDNIKYFVARYLTQRFGDDENSTVIDKLGDKDWLDKTITDENDPEWGGNYSRRENVFHEIETILHSGFQKYIKIHEVDIPLYDKLYEEFDNLRESGRYPLEVFLGRDGIYAWIGRRTQDVARRRKLGPEGRKKLRETGEVMEIHPQYIVYPRYFRDNLNYEVKRQFLEQEGISPDADPLFYDTGYTGTIPEQIMKVMDFSEEDIERRIRLLSAPYVHRRVKGIPENARSEIIEYIEHNAKTEEVAEGLIIDEKTGKIRHIAKPTNPQEQFGFMMVKQAIARHYWLQEQLHHEPSGNVNLDSEHYIIRIRQDYVQILPKEFMSDPKAFFDQHGELLKSSKGEGKYPDEEVILFKLTDGTEIVAKRIELRKAKEARREFTILIAAKKAGLPTAEPVGFLSGKEDTNGSYLLMKKLEGRSGRKFEKELKESGKYSDGQIKDIMRQVAEKNREMAELFRITLKIDKHWRIKDTIIEFNEETGEVGSIVPIDWERAQDYNPNTLKEIDEIK